MHLKVLIIEDCEDDAALIGHYLQSCGFDPRWQRVDRSEDLAEAVEDRRWDLVLCDLSMPQLTPFQAVDCVRNVNPNIPIIIVTGSITDDIAVKLLQHGVEDVVTKDDLPRLKAAITRELALAEVRRDKIAADVRLAAALENLDQGVALYGADGRLIICNRRYKGVLDRYQDEIGPGASYAQLLRIAFENGQFAPHYELQDPDLQLLMACDTPTGARPLRIEHFDGRWVETKRHCTEDGGVVTVTTDITENKKREEELIQQALELARINDDLIHEIRRREATEEALRESESRAEAIFESAVDGMITFNGDFLIETVNPATERIFGYGAEELINLHIHHLMLVGGGPVEPAGNQSRPSPALDHLRGTNLRLATGWRKDGEAFPIELTISPVTLRNRVIYTGIIRDVTERIKLDRMKSEFVSVVSHELRTPLTSIRGALALMNTSVVGELSERARAMVSIGLQNSERLLRLINDILDMEKIESGTLEFTFEPILAGMLVEAAVLENSAYLDQFDVRLCVDNQAPDAVIRADQGRLMQVLANLMSNAAKYSPKNGAITLGITRRGEALRIWVKDEGPGIPEAFRSQMFRKFSQVDSSDTRQKGGTGLGLSIAKVIVERHGGTIDFESSDSRGTKFYIDLPLCEANSLPAGRQGAA
jgi:PAS domain S-box-containing protein